MTTSSLLTAGTTVKAYDHAIDTIAAALGCRAEDTEQLRLIARLTAEGRLTTQIPHLTVSPTPQGGYVANSIDMTRQCRMFTEGLLVWKTDKGPVSDPDGRNPATGRILRARFLHMTQACILKHAAGLHAVYQASSQRAGAMDRPTFVSEMCAGAIA